MSAHSAYTVALKFLKLALENGQSLTPMQLQKLVYIAHGWSLAIRNEPLVRDSIYAWKYGPVIEALYHRLKKFGRDPVTLSQGRINVSLLGSEFTDIDEEIIEGVWETYGDLSGPQLSDLTHETGTPWDTVWNERNGRGRSGALIDDETISEHYRELLSE